MAIDQFGVRAPKGDRAGRGDRLWREMQLTTERTNRIAKALSKPIGLIDRWFSLGVHCDH